MDEEENLIYKTRHWKVHETTIVVIFQVLNYSQIKQRQSLPPFQTNKTFINFFYIFIYSFQIFAILLLSCDTES